METVGGGGVTYFLARKKGVHKILDGSAVLVQ